MPFDRAHILLPLLPWIALALLPATAWAGGACRVTACAQDASLAARIAALACREHALWYRPFIDTDGRLASMTVAEAETVRLSDGATPAWKRVADYWRGSGLLWSMTGFPGASECAHASNDGYPSPHCRAFLVDRPWSAAFVSWVMVQAGVPGFRPSPSHLDYVRDAYHALEHSPFHFTDPDRERPASGDLLCFVRGANAVQGHAGFAAWLASDTGGSIGMHCDIVVAASPDGDSKLYLIGGNVLQGVTMRMLHLNRAGRLWSLPRGNGNPGCSPDHPAMCSFNRQNWVALLKLKPLAPLARPLPEDPAPQHRQPCCVYCVVGSGVPRCPKPPQPETTPPPGA